MKKSFIGNQEASKGFSLIEVVMALGICSFCLIALIGLLSQGLSSNRDTVSQTEAAGIARMVQTDLSVRKILGGGTTNNETSRFKITVASGAKKTFFLNADGTNANTSRDATYRVDVSLGTPASTEDVIPAYILVTWPSAANPSGAITKPVGSFEVVTAINP